MAHIVQKQTKLKVFFYLFLGYPSLQFLIANIVNNCCNKIFNLIGLCRRCMKVYQPNVPCDVSLIVSKECHKLKASTC